MRVFLAFFLLASAAFAQDRPIPQQGSPPVNLAPRADGHFSANDDPENPDRYEVHVVVRGETLSGIAGQVLRNSRLWPQLWEQNEHIVNPHWIYPNDRILVQPITQITEATPPSGAPVPPSARQRAGASQSAVNAPAPVQDIFVVTPPKSFSEVKIDDLYCSGFVQVAAVPGDLKVIAKYDAAGGALATEADYLYLSQGSEEGLRPGDLFNVLRPTKKIENRTLPRQERQLGMHYLEVAQLQVIMPQPAFALARVIHSCDAVELGDIMIPLQRVDVPAVPRPRPFNAFVTGSGGVVGSVVASLDGLANSGTMFKTSKSTGVRRGSLAPLEMGSATEGRIVYVDVGQADGVKPGDVMMVSRLLEIDNQRYSLPKETELLERQRAAVGEIIILKVKERVSTALVTYSKDAIFAGDSVERR